MEQTGSYEFWLSALVGGGVVLVINKIKAKWEPLPMTLWLFAAICTAVCVIPLSWIFGKPITPDTVTNSTALAMTTYGGFKALLEHREERAARVNGADSSPTNITGG